MKNIHIIPTYKPSRLSILHDDKLHLGTSFKFDVYVKPQNIYVTSDEEGKQGDYVYDSKDNVIRYIKKYLKDDWIKKIILTTDQELINDGVQAIDDEFLEWFVKNPSCEEVQITKEDMFDETYGEMKGDYYKIIIPTEESKDFLERTEFDLLKQETIEEEMEQFDKQETLEQAAEGWSNEGTWCCPVSFEEGAKWQQERSYSEEEVITLIRTLSMDEDFNSYCSMTERTAKHFMEQYKQKKNSIS